MRTRHDRLLVHRSSVKVHTGTDSIRFVTITLHNHLKVELTRIIAGYQENQNAITDGPEHRIYDAFLCIIAFSESFTLPLWAFVTLATLSRSRTNASDLLI